MARPERTGKKVAADIEPADDNLSEQVNLARFLSQKAVFKGFSFWIVGDTPLICHSWSEKARLEMLQKQTGAIKAAKAKRDAEADFRSSLYKIDDDRFGFPATAVKKCMLSAAHKDKGIPQTVVMRSLWIDAPFVRVQTAHPGAVCDLPLLVLHGGDPEMREDMVRIGAGMRKTANLAWRGQFKVWALRVVGRYNASVLNELVLEYLINEAGMACGIGDWRNEKSGMFGAFHLAKADEEKQWDAFAKGKGPLPKPRTQYLEAAE